MSLVPKKIDVISLVAEDLAATKAFYERVFGAPPVFEDGNSAVFKFENMMVNLLDVAAAPDLVAPAAVAGPDAGARAVISMFVDDVDAACAELAGLGVELLNGPVDRPWGMRTVSFADPAGHIWELGQDLD